MKRTAFWAALLFFGSRSILPNLKEFICTLAEAEFSKMTVTGWLCRYGFAAVIVCTVRIGLIPTNISTGDLAGSAAGGVICPPPIICALPLIRQPPVPRHFQRVLLD